MAFHRYSRAGVFSWSPENCSTPGFVAANFAQSYDPSSSASPQLEFTPLSDFGQPNIAPKFQADLTYRFNEITWCNPTASNSDGLICGGTGDGTVAFIDAATFVNDGAVKVISARKDHQGQVLSVDVSSDGSWLLSAGGSGQLLLWSLADPSSPYSPGQPNFDDQVRTVRWNRMNSHVAASISAARCSIWDLRRNGSPVLEFAEFGHHSDWTTLSWCPVDESQLFIASRNDAYPVVQKWDIRFPTEPVITLGIHTKGVTAMDWHPIDQRLLVTASHDGQTKITNPSTGEQIGAIAVEPNDRIHRLRWSKAFPDFVAIQYLQNPIQIFSVSGAGGGADGNQHVVLNVVPSWVSAAPVGASFALGGRIATHEKQWDESTQQYKYVVEVKQVSSPDEQLGSFATELLSGLSSPAGALAFCEKRVSECQMAPNPWEFLRTRLIGGGRSAYLKNLGVCMDNPGGDSAAAPSIDNLTTQTRGLSMPSAPGCSYAPQSVMNGNPRSRSSSVSSGSGQDRAALGNICKQQQLTFDAVVQNTSSPKILDALVRNKEEEVVDELCAQQDFFSALLLAMEKQPSLVNKVVGAYLSDSSIALSKRSMAAICYNNIGAIASSCSSNNFERCLSLAFSQLSGPDFVSTLCDLREQAFKRSENARASIIDVVLGNVNGITETLPDLRNEERIALIMLLYDNSAKSSQAEELSTDLQRTIHKVCERFVANSSVEVVGKLLSMFEPTLEELRAMKSAVFESLGMSQTASISNFSHGENQRGRLTSVSSNSSNLRRPSYPADVVGRQQQYSFAVNQQSPRSSVQPSFPQNPAVPPPGQGYAYSQPSYSPNSHLPGGPMTAQPGVASFNQQPPMPPSAFNAGYQAGSPMMAAPPIVPTMPSSANIPYMVPNSPSMQPQEYRSPSVVNQSEQQIPASVPSGWNDPPPIVEKKCTSPVRKVMEVNWKPMDVQPAPTPYGYNPIRPAQYSGPGAVQAQPSPPQTATPATPPVTLNPSDQRIVDQLVAVCETLAQQCRQPISVKKCKEAERRIKEEMVPRLALNKFSQHAHSLLFYLSQQAQSWQIPAALQICQQLVQSSGDFAEVSAFIPSIKAMLHVAQSPNR